MKTLPPKIIALLKNVESWQALMSRTTDLSKQEKGDLFENLSKFYLGYFPAYKSVLKNVWLWKEVPTSVLKHIGLPSNDMGIDILAETYDGEYWGVQCKFLQEEKQKLSHRKLSTFVSLSAGLAKNISFLVVATTVDEYADLYKGKNNIGFITSEDWNKVGKEFFGAFLKSIKGQKIILKPLSPRPHQAKAIKGAITHFVDEKNSRGKLIFPCGAGKSLTGFWIREALKADKVVVAVPSLSLVKQTLEVYLRESVAICYCIK